MAAYRERPKTSLAWEHFEIQDPVKCTATCNHCQDLFSYRTSVSNLVKHLRKKHNYASARKEDEDSDGEEKSDITDRRKIIKSEVWEYFEIKDSENRVAICNLCFEEFSYRSTTANLWRHLKRKHSDDIVNKDVGSEDETDLDKTDNMDQRKMIKSEACDTDLEKTSKQRERSRYSTAWDHFTIADEEKKMAECNLCGTLCSYRSSVTNLMRHARRKHNIDIIRHDESDSEDSSSPPPRAGRSILWLYFRKVDPEAKVSQCLICKKMLSHSSSITNLKKHLVRKHPNVLIPEREDGNKRILLASGGELFELDTRDNDVDDDMNNQTDTLPMDTVYLEDLEALEQEPEPTKKKRKLTKIREHNYEKLVKEIHETSSEGEVTFSKKYVRKQQDTLDYFGKYLTSLLKQLPKEISNQLQSDFVKQAINAQQTYEAQNVADTPSNAYSITITAGTDKDGDVNVAEFEPVATENEK